MSDMSDFEQLKPCPFCGGEVKLEQTINRTGWGVVCRNSLNLGGTCAIEQIPSKEKQAAITRWNTRAAKQSMQGEHVGTIGHDFETGNPYVNWRIDTTQIAGAKLYTHAPDSAARIAELEAENAKRKMAIEYDQADDDAEWEPPHPIFQLAQERDNFMFRVNELEAEIARRQKELEEARKDAERYRWLRAQHNNSESGIAVADENNVLIEELYAPHVEGLDLDAAIDASLNIKGGAE